MYEKRELPSQIALPTFLNYLNYIYKIEHKIALKNNTVEKHLKKWETIQQLFLSEFNTEMYVTRLRSMEHSSANILTHCVDEGWGDGIGVGVGKGNAGLFKKLYDLESLFFASTILL